MPDLMQTLQGNDLGFLNIVAQAWGVDLKQPDAASARPVLAAAMQDANLFHEVLDAQPPEANQAIQFLLENGGKVPWGVFCRRYGDIRVMGPGKRDRERPDLAPESITERLYYRALIGKAFFNLPPEPQEYAYLPDDLAAFLTDLTPGAAPLPGRPATNEESAEISPANDRILDHTCTLLAAIRCGLPLAPFEGRWSIPTSFLLSLLQAAGLLDANFQLESDSVRSFLEASRGIALAQLNQAWLESATLNELRLLPGLEFVGQWDNQPRQVRRTLLDLLQRLPSEAWWSLESLVEWVRANLPDYQRPGGDYDSWFIRKAGSETFLRGSEAWDEVDGPLVRFMICGPLHWLGRTDLATSTPGTAPAAFRPSPWAGSLAMGQSPSGQAKEDAHLRISQDGHLRVPVLAPRSVRYQVARFCDWESETPEEYRFRLSPASMERAQQQGLHANHLLILLKRSTAAPLPPSLVQALERWEKFGTQAVIETETILRLASPEMLPALRKSRAARFLGEAYNDLTVTVKAGGEAAIRQALAELGYLTEDSQ